MGSSPSLLICEYRMNLNLGWIWFHFILLIFSLLNALSYLARERPVAEHCRHTFIYSQINLGWWPHQAPFIMQLSPGAICTGSGWQGDLSDLFNSEYLWYELSSLPVILSAVFPVCFFCRGCNNPTAPTLAYLEGACLSWVLLAVSLLTSRGAGCLLAMRLDRYVPFPWGNCALQGPRLGCSPASPPRTQWLCLSRLGFLKDFKQTRWQRLKRHPGHSIETQFPFLLR